MILIGDHHCAYAPLYQAALREELDLQFIADPEDILAILGTFHLDLLLLNVDVLGEAVYSLCANIRSNLTTKHIPIVLLNVENKAEEKFRGFQVGVNDILTKPFLPAELGRRVSQQLHNQELQRIRQQQADQFKQTISRQRVLSRAISRIRRSLKLENIFHSSAQEIHYALGCDRVVIYQFNEDWSGYFVAEAMTPGWRSLVEDPDETVHALQSNSASDQDRCIVKLFNADDQKALEDTYLQETDGGMYRKGVPYRAVNDVYQAGFPSCYLELLESFQAKAYVILPIFCGDRLWGLLGIYQNSNARNWKAEELEMLGQIASQLGIAIQQSDLLYQLRKAKDAAEAANKAKSLFLANINHELRTPLSAMLGFTELLTLDDNLTEDQLDSLESIAQSGKHLLNLINDVLSMSQIEAGKVNLNYEEFSLAQCLDVVQDIIALAAEQKGLQLIFDVAPDLPPTVYLDEKKLRQILINLLNNAVKFTRQGSVTLKITRDYSLPHALLFRVMDTGIGMDDQEVQLLFNAFQQTESGIQSKQGTGLGLAISQNFVQLMGGKIQVRSRREEGTEFWFTLSTAPPEHPQDLHAHAPELDTLPPFASLKNQELFSSCGAQIARPQILIIEDQGDQRQLLQTQLNGLGFVTKTAMNGQEGLDCWYSWQPDLVLLDLRMPSISGWEVAEKIHGAIASSPEFKKPKIILVTADIFYQEREVSLNDLCDDVIYKPVNFDLLFRCITQHLNLSPRLN